MMYSITLITMSLFNQTISLNLFMDGGPLFMSLILICLVLSLLFLVRGFMATKKSSETAHKQIQLAVDASLLGLVLGFLGSVLGLIAAFDSVEAIGNPDPAIFAAGLKISLLTTAFGLLTFVIARIGILLLRAITK